MFTSSPVAENETVLALSILAIRQWYETIRTPILSAHVLLGQAPAQRCVTLQYMHVVVSLRGPATTRFKAARKCFCVTGIGNPKLTAIEMNVEGGFLGPYVYQTDTTYTVQKPRWCSTSWRLSGHGLTASACGSTLMNDSQLMHGSQTHACQSTNKAHVKSLIKPCL